VRNWRHLACRLDHNLNNFYGDYYQARENCRSKSYIRSGHGWETTNLCRCTITCKRRQVTRKLVYIWQPARTATLFFDFLPIEAMSIKGFKPVSGFTTVLWAGNLQYERASWFCAV